MPDNHYSYNDDSFIRLADIIRRAEGSTEPIPFEDIPDRIAAINKRKYVKENGDG